MQKYGTGYLVLLFVFLTAAEVTACRYNIRDVGFVDLGSDIYRLYGYVDGDTSTDLQAHMNDLAQAVFLDSNILFERVPVQGMTNPQATELLSQLQLKTFPVAVLSIAERDPLVIPVPTDRDQMAATFEKLIASPLRETLLKKLKDVYALVLVVHGPDSEQNTWARDAAQSAISEVTQVMSLMPKASGRPPVLLELPFAQRAEERVVLWSLGIDENDTEPAAVILYGRGRMLGKVLRGLEISGTKLNQFLSIIGLDCECGLDRRWMTGRRIPIKWDQDTQHLVAKSLDFDPESPMVKMEISRILMKGPNPDGAFDLNNLSRSSFGYQEIEISLTPTEPQQSPVQDPVQNGQVEKSKETVPPDETVDQPAPRLETEPSALSGPVMTALVVIGAFILGVGFAIAFRKNKNA